MTIHRADSPLLWAYLPEHPRLLLTEAVEVLNAQIPDDFEYTIYFESDEPGLLLEFEDGSVTGTGDNLPISPAETISEYFAGWDWDARRATAIQGCQMFDELAEFAKTQPSRLPSTKLLQKSFREHMKEWIKEKRRDFSKVFVLAFREDEEDEDEEGFRDLQYESLTDLSDDLPNIMTVGFLIITVVADGKPLPVIKIDHLKNQALDCLKDMPMSYAKATGRL